MVCQNKNSINQFWSLFCDAWGPLIKKVKSDFHEKKIPILFCEKCISAKKESWNVSLESCNILIFEPVMVNKHELCGKCMSYKGDLPLLFNVLSQQWPLTNIFHGSGQFTWSNKMKLLKMTLILWTNRFFFFKFKIFKVHTILINDKLPTQI